MTKGVYGGVGLIGWASSWMFFMILRFLRVCSNS